jgi:hypothetical protein
MKYIQAATLLLAGAAFVLGSLIADAQAAGRAAGGGGGCYYCAPPPPPPASNGNAKHSSTGA